MKRTATVPAPAPQRHGRITSPARWRGDADGRERDRADRAVCVVLHDVAPSRWDACLRVMAQVHAVASQVGVRVRMTLLVVPEMHGAPSTPDFVRWLQRLAQAGHEVTLHGWRHLDEGPPATGWWQRLVRQHYTAGEGEFAALDRRQAAERLAKGRAWLARQGLQTEGFVAPAWLMSAASWEAVEAAGFRYTCTLNQLVRLPGPDPLTTLPGPAHDIGPTALPALQRTPAPGEAARRVFVSRSLVFSTRSAWRRALSIVWNGALARWLQARQAPLLRLELHPSDADHARVRHCWTDILATALRQRQPMTLAQASRRLL